ncbi:MAG: hypothetical protein MI784_07290 [Cytophagales bacterium]|nr:hypothetical protein [Cytophagales bacterium]
MKQWTKNILDYGTAGFYVSPKYGRDLPEKPTYHPTNNPDDNAYGGPNNPLKSWEKFFQSSHNNFTCVIDNSYNILTSVYNERTIVADGNVIFSSSKISQKSFRFYHTYVLSFFARHQDFGHCFIDCFCYNVLSPNVLNSIVVNSSFVSNGTVNVLNSTIIDCYIKNPRANIINTLLISCKNGSEIGYNTGMIDYNVVFGKLKYKLQNNLKTIKIKYGKMLNSFDAEDLGISDWRELFNNPIDVDVQNYMYADFSLKPTVSDKVLYGGRFGDLIGALPVGYRFTAADLWNTYKKSADNLKLSSDILGTADNTKDGAYESIEIPLGNGSTPVSIDKNQLAIQIAWHVEGWANARISKNAYETANPSQNQRAAFTVEFDWKLNGKWTGWQEHEIGREMSGIDNATHFKFRFVMRKEVTA